MLDLPSSGSRGRAGHRRLRGAWLSVVAVAGVLALGVPTASVAAVRAGGSPSASAQTTAAQTTRAYQTTKQYVTRFWSRWIYFSQQQANLRAFGPDQLIGPAIPMGPQFRLVNAINDDTIYASSLYTDLRLGPAILTIPPTPDVYSILPLDGFGATFNSVIPAQTPGTYALVLKGWRGRLPRGVTKVVVPYPVTEWLFRADKYSSTGVNMIAEATKFRLGLRMTTLAKYMADPNSGAPEIRPLFPTFAFSFKVFQDISATVTPNAFLRLMQRAVHSPDTQPMYKSDLQLSAAFDKDFAAAQQAARRGNPVPLATIDAAVRSAYREIDAHYRTHYTPGTKWVHFNNFAAWGTAYLDRAAATEYCQYCNTSATAGYYDGFVDESGQTLNGARHTYTLTFPAGDIPQAKRFWSLTAYVPHTIELVRNPAKKYVVASYTPGLVKNPDGSITIYMAPTRPAGAPMANWLPVPRRDFSVMLRVYGPTGNTASPTYAPAPITVAP